MRPGEVRELGTWKEDPTAKKEGCRVTEMYTVASRGIPSTQ